MQFSYFTLGNNHCADNRRGANTLILDQATYVETADMHSVWIGDHHFHTFPGLKPHPRVTDEMDRFTAEVAPPFAERT
jgi:alkanesulfonate monooxygenase SsuD/methylene tetrahydromethanopterin reductase-like flavin-dependent oxidoreductase (luciferase family)